MDFPQIALVWLPSMLADVLLAGMVPAVFGAWRRWGRFWGEKPECTVTARDK